MSLLIEGGHVLVEGRLLRENVFIDKGKIQQITPQRPNADQEINAKGKIVLPGLIDCHVHCREPGLTHKEDFYTASMAAAAGGVTTFFDMPNTHPPTFDIEDLEAKREMAKKSLVNYGFYFGASSNNIEQIKKARNIAAVKIYMNETTGNLLLENDTIIEEIFKHAPRIAVHAEGEQVRKAIHLAKKYKKFLYLCHISSKDEIALIKKEKTENIFCEVAPHHLFLTDSDHKKMKGLAYMKPVLKSKKDQNALWKGIEDNTVDTIGTDHAPHTLMEKKSNSPPAGVPGLETMLPLLLNAVNEKKLTLQKLSELTAANPARIFGIKNKGIIKEGYDADVVVVDLNKEYKISNDALFTKCKWSPFHGKKVKGAVDFTIVNGNLIYHHREFERIRAREVVFSG